MLEWIRKFLERRRERNGHRDVREAEKARRAVENEVAEISATRRMITWMK